MPKTAIVTDSNSGISAQTAKELGVFVLPMPFFVNDQPYLEGIDLSIESFYNHMDKGDNITTSQPAPGAVTALWEEILETHDEILHIPMSSALSASCESAQALARDYNSRVAVADNRRISVTQRQSVLDAIELRKLGADAATMARILEKDSDKSSIYIMLNTLYYLKKGGRITPAAAALGTLLRIKPVLQIQGYKLDSFAKARTLSAGKNIMLTAIREDVAKRFGGMEKADVHLAIVHSRNLEGALEFRREVEAVFPGKEIHIDEMSLSVACHIGPGVLALACCQRMDYAREVG